MKKTVTKTKLINAFQVQSIAAKESERNKAHCWFAWAAVISKWLRNAKHRLTIDYQAESQMGWLVEATQRQMLPGNNPVASQLNYKEGGHLSGTQGSQVYTWGEGITKTKRELENMITCEHVIEKTIIFKAIVHTKTKLFSCCSNPYDLLSWNTKGEIGQSFSYNETEWGYVQSSSKINVFQRINTYM